MRISYLVLLTLNGGSFRVGTVRKVRQLKNKNLYLLPTVFCHRFRDRLGNRWKMCKTTLMSRFSRQEGKIIDDRIRVARPSKLEQWLQSHTRSSHTLIVYARSTAVSRNIYRLVSVTVLRYNNASDTIFKSHGPEYITKCM